jgi:preprotein translocase subunit SecF
MFNIVERRHWYFLFSALIITPGLVAMLYSTFTSGSPVKLGIDFTGGSLLELRFDQTVQPAEVRQVLAENGFSGSTVTTTADQTILIRTKEMEPEVKAQVEGALRDTFGSLEELRFESVGPAVGAEVTRTAAIAVAVAALFILLFIIFAFRKVPYAFRYGVCAITAMIHDILVTVGLFSIASLMLNWEAAALFLTALLTPSLSSSPFCCLVGQPCSSLWPCCWSGSCQAPTRPSLMLFPCWWCGRPADGSALRAGQPPEAQGTPHNIGSCRVVEFIQAC